MTVSYILRSSIRFAAVSIIAMALPAFAQTTSSTGALPDGTSVINVETEGKQETKNLSIGLGLEMAEAIAQPETGVKENTTSLSIAPSYKLSDLLTLGGRVIINQDNFGQRETTASDITLSLGIKGFDLGYGLTSTHSLGTIAPIKETTVEDDRLQGNISTTNGLAYTHDYFSLSYKLGLLRNFHEFTQNRAGSPNIEYRVSHIFELQVPITEKFSASAAGVYRVGYTYGGFERYGFIFDADLSYEIVKDFSVNIGTSNDGSALKSNGVDSNLSAFNENSSVVRGGISYVY